MFSPRRHSKARFSSSNSGANIPVTVQLSQEWVEELNRAAEAVSARPQLEVIMTNTSIQRVKAMLRIMHLTKQTQNPYD